MSQLMNTEQEFPRDFPKDLQALHGEVSAALRQAGMLDPQKKGTFGEGITVTAIKDTKSARVSLAGKLSLEQEDQFWEVINQFGSEGEAGRLEFYTARNNTDFIIACYFGV